MEKVLIRARPSDSCEAENRTTPDLPQTCKVFTVPYDKPTSFQGVGGRLVPLLVKEAEAPEQALIELIGSATLPKKNSPEANTGWTMQWPANLLISVWVVVQRERHYPSTHDCFAFVQRRNQLS